MSSHEPSPIPEDPRDVPGAADWSRAGMTALLCLARVVTLLELGFEPDQFPEFGHQRENEGNDE